MVWSRVVKKMELLKRCSVQNVQGNAGVLAILEWNSQEQGPEI